MAKIEIEDVFNGFGVPNSTYVAQENGKHETLLRRGVKEKGNLCLITGSSKTGKTTLYNKVLQKLGKVDIVVRCDATINADEFWKRPLEKVDFKRLKEDSKSTTTESQASGKIGGKIGWAWLAGLIGEVSLGIKKGKSETEIREKILAKPSPDHLIPLLKYSNAILVVEDFHYLDEVTQKNIFQQWKAFTDEQVSVIVVGTTHHGVDLAYANPDLVGRIQQIDLTRWSDSDLFKIADKGFKELGMRTPILEIDVISKESSGLPIVTQQACGQLFIDKGKEVVKKGEPIEFVLDDVFRALYNVASTRYKQFETWYDRLSEGPRKKARKYNTYELLLTTFTLDPLQFGLKRYEIDERIAQLPLKKEMMPPSASINSTLSALKRFQNNNGFELLEWSKRDQAIYVLEPAFLFFLRWRKERTTLPSITELIKELFPFFKRFNL